MLGHVLNMNSCDYIDKSLIVAPFGFSVLESANEMRIKLALFCFSVPGNLIILLWF